jgi:hypothetical protein
MKIIIKYAAINSVATALYVSLLASVMFFTSGITPVGYSFLVPPIMLLLFVFSAGLTGSLVFGRPVLWYLEGKKKEAVYLLAYTLAGVLIITVAAALVLYAKTFKII